VGTASSSVGSIGLVASQNPGTTREISCSGRDRSHDPHEAMVGGLVNSGRVIFAAGAVMVAGFLTFALSGPLRPKGLGIILGFAVLLDALLVRLMLVPILLRLTGWAAGGCRGGSTALPDVRFGH
jgi:putative drug exporter of the RND superfamily